MDIVWILCYSLTVIQTVYCSPCPLVNERMNITRTIDPLITYISWNKNKNPLTLAAYNSSSGTCTGTSTAPEYTIYCGSGGVYTLEIHNPVNGDLYETEPVTPSPRTYVQDPVNIDVTLTPQLSADKILNKSEILSVSCSVGCTTPTPYIQWVYQVGETQHVIRNMTTSPTSCSSGIYSKRSITDNLDVSDSLFNLNGVQFKVVCQVQYSDCDINIDGNSSASTDYFITFKDTPGGSNGLAIWALIVIVIAIVIVVGAVCWLVCVRCSCCYIFKKREKKKQEEKDGKNGTDLQVTDTNKRQATLLDKNDVEKADTTQTSNSGHKMEPLDNTTKDHQTTTNKSVGQKNTSAKTNKKSEKTTSQPDGSANKSVGSKNTSALTDNKSEMTTSQPDGSTNAPKGITEQSAATSKQESNASRPLPQPSNLTPNMLVNNPLPPIAGQRLK